MRDLVDAAARAGALALVALAFGLGFGEGAIGLDLLVPGEIGMVFVGAAAAAGDAPLPAIILAGAAGAVAGDSVGYWLGRRFGLRLVRHWAWTRRHLEPSVERARVYFARRGGAAVFVARFVGALRAVVPVVAGTGGMSYRRFLAWDVPAALLWTTLVVSLGYFAGATIADAVDSVGLATSVVAVAVVFAVLWFLRRRRRAGGATPPAAMGGKWPPADDPTYDRAHPPTGGHNRDRVPASRPETWSSAPVTADRVIILGDDGSPASARAWQWVVDQHWPGWRVVILTAGTTTEGTSHAGAPSRSAPAATGIVAVEGRRVDADAGPALATATGASLLVIGSARAERRADPDADRFGTTTEYLVGRLPCVLVVATRPGTVRRVLVTVDGSRDAHTAARALTEMPWAPAIEHVAVLGVHEERRNVERGIEEALGALLTAGLPAQRASASGPTVPAILDAAERLGADLVTAGARGVNPLRRLLVGSTVRALVRAGEPSVLLAVHHDDGARGAPAPASPPTPGRPETSPTDPVQPR